MQQESLSIGKNNLFIVVRLGLTLFAFSLEWDITPHQGYTGFALSGSGEPAVSEITDRS